MIKFFRHIRQEIMEKNLPSREGTAKQAVKTGKPAYRMGRYFKYAIGEIILVVIGILIALSINNWNQDRKSNNQELKYLKNLQSDLWLEYENNDSIIEYRWGAAKAAAYLLDVKTLQTSDDLILLETKINEVFERKNFIPTNNTYKELLSSGNLNYITNDSIKNSLLELDKTYVSIANVEYHMYREYEEYLYNNAVSIATAINLFDFQKTAETGGLVISKPSQIASDTLIPQYKKLLQNREFINGLRLSVMNNIGLKGAHSKMTKQLKKIDQLISSDIKRF